MMKFLNIENFNEKLVKIHYFYKKIENVLSVNDSNMHATGKFPNVRVSEMLAKTIYDVCRNTQPTKQY